MRFDSNGCDVLVVVSIKESAKNLPHSKTSAD